MTPLVRDADESDLAAITALYGREVEGGTATFETTPPTLEEMTGRGRALLVALIARARAMGLRHVIGAISDSDTSAASIALHGSLGFRQVGVYRQVGWKFERWLDVALMQLDMNPEGDPPPTPGLDLTGGLA